MQAPVRALCENAPLVIQMDLCGSKNSMHLPSFAAPQCGLALRCLIHFGNTSVQPALTSAPPPPRKEKGGRDWNFGTMQQATGHKPALRTEYARKAVGQAWLERKWRFHT